MTNVITDTETETEMDANSDQADNIADDPVHDATAEPTPARSKLEKTKKVIAERSAQTTPEVRILKVSRCPSLSGRSELTYHVGCIDDAIQLRVYQNTGKGYFNQEWIPFDTVNDLLTSHELFTAETLRSVFLGKSVNTAGFFMAVLKHLGLIEISKANRRCYSHKESAAFEAQTAQLIASGVSVAVAEPAAAKPPASKKGMLKPKSK